MAQPALPANYTAERIAPTFLPSRESHVTVPLLRSLITGAFFGITVGGTFAFLAVMGKATAWYAIELGAVAGGIVFFGGAFFYWLYITGQYDGLLSRVETVTGLDIDQDGKVGPPERREISVKVETTNGRQFEDLPGDEAALVEFAKDVVSGRLTFSERGAIESGYGQDNFKKLRDIFIARHWAEWKDANNRNQGVNLYRAGKSILMKIADTPAEPESAVGMTNQIAERGTNRGSLT